MKVLLVVVVLAVVVLAAKPFNRVGNDPADSWLAYVVASGDQQLITYVNATWIVPSYPTTREGGNAPGWWFGIEPNPASNLIQPILAYGFQGDIYSIFNGYYQWDDSYWWYSDVGTVTPGNTINAFVAYDESSNSYNMYIACKETGWSTTNNIPVESGKIYSDIYFVVEHQPNTCSEYPSNGEITFTDIKVSWQNKFSTPQWKALEYQDACNCQGQIIDSETLKFTWQTQ